MKTSSASYVFLMFGLIPAFAQFIGPSQPPPHLESIRNRNLSPQQQGQILTDIQQHQHRFRFQNNQQTVPVQNWQVYPSQTEIKSSRENKPSSTEEFSNFDPYTFNFRTEKADPEQEKQRLRELKEKQAIIEKHNQFVEKQYEKALKKAQEEHEEFLRKQREERRKLHQKFKNFNQFSPIHSQNGPRFLYPEEAPLFEKAVKKYYEEHPTTTTTTTTTTTPKPKITEEDDSQSKEESYDNLKALRKLQIQDKKSNDLSSSQEQTASSNTVKYIQTIDDLEMLKQQYKNQKINKDDILTQIKLAIGDNPEEGFDKNVTTREISLPSGEKVQIFKTNNPNLLQSGSLNSLLLQQASTTTTTTSRPPSEILKELTRGVLPPGANYDLLKPGENGSLEKISNPGNLPGERKITFVLLEEQDDGSFKVQGVKGNEKENVDVDSVLKKIKEGEIKIPQPVRASKPPSPPTTRRTTPNPTITQSYTSPLTTTETSKIHNPNVKIHPNAFALSANDEAAVSIPSISSSNIPQQIYTTTPSSIDYNSYSSTTRQTISHNYINSPEILVRSNSNSFQDLQQGASAASSVNPQLSKGLSFVVPSTPSAEVLDSSSQEKTNSFKRQSSTPEQETSEINKEVKPNHLDLPDILKKHSLHAMARFLKQSGLDSILNETGPYTVFVPSDKAFKQLLIQLGGPEKAEEKFKENPRLLSGLLLHHVIPGAFTLESLQDEMTGVSLAGTQLRVNQYNMHDEEWNDIKVTTINGAQVLDDKKNIEIPQGIAHAIDKVMFPLPVGDLVQTLQSDRERRFTQFLRALFSSNVAETLQGSKVYTLFAPTDKAFASLPKEEVERIISDKSLAKEFVLRHIIPGSLYTHGMRYYQVKDSLLADKQVTITKSAGKTKVNNHNLLLQNIPATNGVIHAIEYLL